MIHQHYGHCLSTVVAYNILVAGRLLIACYVGSKYAGEITIQQESQRVIQAASLLLHMMVVSLPIALGSAEVLDETCRGAYGMSPPANISLWSAHYKTRLVNDRRRHGKQERLVSITEPEGRSTICFDIRTTRQLAAAYDTSARSRRLGALNWSRSFAHQVSHSILFLDLHENVTEHTVTLTSISYKYRTCLCRRFLTVTSISNRHWAIYRTRVR